MKWARPVCEGTPPAPRESHSATLCDGGGGERKLVVFGGSGGGERKYLNDVHVLDLERMTWSSLEVKGEKPVARDSHAAFTMGWKLFVYGGDCGDRYLGGLDVLDLQSFTWSKVSLSPPLPVVVYICIYEYIILPIIPFSLSSAALSIFPGLCVSLSYNDSAILFYTHICADYLFLSLSLYVYESILEDYLHVHLSPSAITS